jgi:hypothetical protein
MYGVPRDLDLRPFMGNYLTQLCIGPWDLQFRFTTGGLVLSVYGHWELRDAAGGLVDQATDRTLAQHEGLRLHFLLGSTVTATRLDPPRSLTLIFDNGMALTVADDSERFVLHPARQHLRLGMPARANLTDPIRLLLIARFP